MYIEIYDIGPIRLFSATGLAQQIALKILKQNYMY